MQLEEEGTYMIRPSLDSSSKVTHPDSEAPRGQSSVLGHVPKSLSLCPKSLASR